MTISFMRKDRNGNPVEVEIWRDQETNNFVRIKRVTYLKNAGFITCRTDIYREESNEEEFLEYINEELGFLNEYKEALKKVSMPEKLDKEENGKISPKDGLLSTIERFKEMKKIEEDEEQR